MFDISINDIIPSGLFKLLLFDRSMLLLLCVECPALRRKFLIIYRIDTAYRESYKHVYEVPFQRDPKNTSKISILFMISFDDSRWVNKYVFHISLDSIPLAIIAEMCVHIRIDFIERPSICLTFLFHPI